MPNSSRKRKRSCSGSGNESNVYKVLQRLEKRLVNLEKKRRHYRRTISSDDSSTNEESASEREKGSYYRGRSHSRRRMDVTPSPVPSGPVTAFVIDHEGSGPVDERTTPSPPRSPSRQPQRQQPSTSAVRDIWDRNHEVMDGEIRIIDPVIDDRRVITQSNDETGQPPVLQKDILSLLGQASAAKDLFSKPIQADVASRWESILMGGLDEDTKNALINKYLPPENCRSINPPAINPEVKIAITESIIRRDERLSHTQHQIASSLSAIGLALTKMLENREGENREYIQLLSDAGRLLANVHFSESKARRELIALNLNKDLKDTLVNTPISGLLFGKNLEERIKTTKELEKTGQQLKPKKRTIPASTSQSSSGNVKGPFPQRSAGGRRNGPASRQAPGRRSYYNQTATYRRTPLKKSQFYPSQGNQNDRRRPRQS